MSKQKLPPGNWESKIKNGIHVIYEKPDNEAAENLIKLYTEKREEFREYLGITGKRKPIKVYIAPNNARFNFLTQGAPDWTGGLAIPAKSTIILKAPRLYPRNQFPVIALHELIHVITYSSKSKRLPRWFSEGLAMYLSGETLYRNRIPLARAVVLDRTYTLDEIENMMKLGPENARVAYLQSINFVEYLVKNYGWEDVAQLQNGYLSGLSGNENFRRVIGKDLFDVESYWHDSLKKRYVWWKIVEWLDITTLIFTAGALIVVFSGGMAIYRRKKYINSDDYEQQEWEGVYFSDADTSDIDKYVVEDDEEEY